MMVDPSLEMTGNMRFPSVRVVSCLFSEFSNVCSQRLKKPPAPDT